MAPPNSVALAAPLPNTYFGNVYGSVAHFPSAYQWGGLAQPFIPSAHYDVDSTGRTLPYIGPAKAPSLALNPPVFGPPRTTTPWPIPHTGPPIIPYPANLGGLVSWWTGHIRIIRDRFRPGVPEAGA